MTTLRSGIAIPNPSVVCLLRSCTLLGSVVVSVSDLRLKRSRFDSGHYQSGQQLWASGPQSVSAAGCRNRGNTIWKWMLKPAVEPHHARQAGEPVEFCEADNNSSWLLSRCGSSLSAHCRDGHRDHGRTSQVGSLWCQSSASDLNQRFSPAFGENQTISNHTCFISIKWRTNITCIASVRKLQLLLLHLSFHRPPLSDRQVMVLYYDQSVIIRYWFLSSAASCYSLFLLDLYLLGTLLISRRY